MVTIKKKRLSCLLTQAELATNLGVSQNTVSQWETGVRNPNIKLLPRIADILGCTVDELLRKDSSSDDEGGEI